MRLAKEARVVFVQDEAHVPYVIQLAMASSIEETALFEAVDLDNLIGINPFVRRPLGDAAESKLPNGVFD